MRGMMNAYKTLLRKSKETISPDRPGNLNGIKVLK
jgi:hypothetical protein